MFHKDTVFIAMDHSCVRPNCFKDFLKVSNISQDIFLT